MAAEFFVGQKIKCMDENDCKWYGAKIKKVEPERVLVQWSNPKWQSSKYDQWIIKAYYNMRIKVLSVDNYFSGNSTEEVSSRMKHINNWTYKELHQWMCSLNGVSVRNQKKIVDTICRDKICGRDFNSSIEDMSDIRDGFPDISDNGVKNIYVGLQLLRQKINVESVVDVQASVKSFNPLKEKKLIPKINQLTYTRASVNIKSVKTWDNNDFLRWIKVLQDIGCFEGNDADTMNYIITQNQYSGKDLYNCNTQNFIMKLFKGRIKKTTAKILKESLFIERQMYIKRQQSKLQIEQGLWQPFLQEKIRVIDYRYKPYRSYRATIKKVFDNKIFVSYDGYPDQQGQWLKTDQWNKTITIINMNNIKSKQPIQNKIKIKKIQNGYTQIQNIYTPIQNKNKKKIQNRYKPTQNTYKPTQNTYKPTQNTYKPTQNDPTQSYAVGYQKPPHAQYKPTQGFDPSTLYDLIKMIGEGSYSKVYKAIDKKSNRIVAIKKVSFKHQRFTKREISVLEACEDNKHIINWFGIFNDVKNKKHWVILEYCAGGSIENCVINATEWPNIATCVVEGLYYLHSKGIIHKDIKPQNILLCNSGVYKLADFGFSENVKNASQMRCGSLYFIAPEILKGNNFNVQADMWSFGVTMYKIATNKYPFQLNTNNEQLERDIKESPPMPMENYASFGRNIKSLINKCLRKDVKKRYSAAKLKQNHPWFHL